MDVKDAVRLAKKYIGEVFADDSISNVGLEEVEFDHRSEVWKITVGFHRPTGLVNPIEYVAPGFLKEPLYDVPYKLVNIDDASGRILSVRHRDLRDTED